MLLASNERISLLSTCSRLATGGVGAVLSQKSLNSSAIELFREEDELLMEIFPVMKIKFN